jgi:hypothetical protein
VQIDRVKRRHDQNAAQQAVDAALGVEQPGQCPCDETTDKTDRRRCAGTPTANEQCRGERGAKRDRAFGRNVWKIKNAEAEINSEREQREDQSDGECAEK